MDKILTRVEAKNFYENDILSRIETIRSKLRSSKNSEEEVVKVFNIERISR
jgi:hypothetical protein